MIFKEIVGFHVSPLAQRAFKYEMSYKYNSSVTLLYEQLSTAPSDSQTILHCLSIAYSTPYNKQNKLILKLQLAIYWFITR